MKQLDQETERIVNEVVDSAVKVHRTLGLGLLESVYQRCLARELHLRGLKVECEIPQPIEYEGEIIEAGYRIDMLIENCILIENKTVDQLLPVHQAQSLTYMKLRKISLGFLLNWNVPIMKSGIRRLILST